MNKPESPTFDGPTAANLQPAAPDAARIAHHPSFRSVWPCLVAGFAILAATAVQGRPPARAGDARLDAIKQALGVRAAHVQLITPVEHEDGSITATVELDGKLRTLSLRKHTMRAEGFEVLVQREPYGPLQSVMPPSVRTYRGTVLEIPGSKVAALLTPGATWSVNAVIRTAGGIFGVQPISSIGGPDDHPIPSVHQEHVVYRADAWTNANGFGCGTTNAHRLFDAAEPAPTGDVAGTGLAIADLAIDTDVEFFQRNGSSVASTVLDVENVMNTVEFIYERDLAITYELTTIVVRTVESDPYSSTDAYTLLCQFRSTWNGTPESRIRRDAAHFFTGKRINGGTIGIAWVGVMCNVSGFIPGCGGNGSAAYGLSESRFTTSLSSRAALTAHELGHNWDSDHCLGSSCHIMCAGLGGCGGLSGSNLKFGPSATNQILNFKASRNCLTNLADPQPIPFFEDFSSTTLPSARWSYSNGASVTTGALQEPSAPNALNLDATGSQEYRDDEVRSNFILLAGTNSPTLSYWTQHRSVPADGALVIEYWSNASQWVEINRLVSDGVDQSVFSLHLHDLPPNARHNRFRVRFRVEVAGSSDDWYIDDVTVLNECPFDDTCDDGVFCNGVERCAGGLCEPGDAPCAAGEACDEDYRACFDPTCPIPIVAGVGGRYLAITLQGNDPVGLFVAPVCNPDAGWYVAAPTKEDNIALAARDPLQAPFLTPAEWGATVHATATDIIPSTDYLVRADCGTPQTPRLSGFAMTRTLVWGDVVGELTGSTWTPANGLVDILDIRAIIDKFTHTRTAPPMPLVDLISIDVSECSTDQSISVLDMLSWVNGFLRNTFSETWPCPNPCNTAAD